MSKTAAEVDSEEIDTDYRYQQIKKVTIVGAVTNVILAFGKITLGYVGQSQVLVADGVHSLADLVSDLIVIVAAKHGSRKADADHPYGHGRIETVVEVLLGVFLVVVAAGIMIDAVSRLSGPEIITIPTWFALVAAFFSIAANEGLYHYTIHISKKVRSQLLKANAWHHRTDAVSSVIAVIGIA
ncbi:MAG: cation diffusion facilitator family transporter, partial [Gammaproteobacteria bacterium]|nr:cation diffusion facilitator family transporter [Gammaproteobacteria bacterium]